MNPFEDLLLPVAGGVLGFLGGGPTGALAGAQLGGMVGGSLGSTTQQTQPQQPAQVAAPTLSNAGSTALLGAGGLPTSNFLTSGTTQQSLSLPGGSGDKAAQLKDLGPLLQTAGFIQSALVAQDQAEAEKLKAEAQAAALLHPVVPMPGVSSVSPGSGMAATLQVPGGFRFF